jgi:excisionase family DNA binding protein
MSTDTNTIPASTTPSKTSINTPKTPMTIPMVQMTKMTPWLTVAEAADRARCGTKTVYREVRAGRLKAAKVGGRRELRLRAEWVDLWLATSAVEVK